MAQQIVGDDGQLESEYGSAYDGEGMISLQPDQPAWFEANAPKVIEHSATKTPQGQEDPSGGGSGTAFPAPNLPNPGDYPAPPLPGYGPAPQIPTLPNQPDPLAPWTETFTAPNPQDVFNDEAFQRSLQEGVKQLQRSAAAKGTLLTGGTLKGITDYGMSRANSQYGDVYNKQFNEYDTRRQNFLTNESNRFNSQKQNALDTWAEQNNVYQMERLNRGDTFDMDAQLFGMANTNRMNNWGISSDYFNMGNTNRMNDFNIFNTTDMNDFTKQYDIASLGRPQAPTL